jgi:hypothetical protein
LSLIGRAAIVAILIFVDLKMRQSQQIALASQYQARTDSGLLNDDPFARYLIVAYGEDFRASFRNLAVSMITETPDE